MRLRTLTTILATAAGVLMGVPSGAAAAGDGPTVYLRAGGEPSATSATAWGMGTAGDQHLLCDWNGDGVATLGVYRPKDATWHVRNSSGGGSGETSFRYGRPGSGDRVLCGDWDGNGSQTPGIFRTSDTTWYLRNANAGGTADVFFRYGRPGLGDSPLAGDWNGDGTDTPGIYRSSDNTWHLINRLGGGVAELTYRYGSVGAGDTPLVGDWDGDQVDTPAIFRASDRSWHLRNAHAGGAADWTFSWGRSTDAPLAGDWDGDGRAEPALSRAAQPTLASTGVDQLLAQLEVASEGSRTGYSRDLFPHWTTTDGCTTRERVLVAESRVTPTTDSTCAVTGSWYSAYDGVSTTTASTFDIDHMVALAEAWDSGASAWTIERRRSYANDLGYAGSLIAVSASSNRSKGDQDPAEWRPSTTGFSCTYATDWTNVKIRWRLTADQAEVSSLRQMLDTCPGAEPRPSSR